MFETGQTQWANGIFCYVCSHSAADDDDNDNDDATKILSTNIRTYHTFIALTCTHQVFLLFPLWLFKERFAFTQFYNRFWYIHARTQNKHNETETIVN